MAGGQGRETGASPIQSCLEQVYDTMKSARKGPGRSPRDLHLRLGSHKFHQGLEPVRALTSSARRDLGRI